MDEEQFGPVLPVLSYTDLDATITEVNSGQYGLGGSVWTRDLIRGAEVADRLEAGTSWVKNTLTSDLTSRSAESRAAGSDAPGVPRESTPTAS